MREKYESLSAGELREVAKARGLKGISALRKDELVPVSYTHLTLPTT